MAKKNFIGAKRKLEFNKVKSNLNRKINRVKKNFGIDISNDIDIPNLKDISSVKEYNAFIRQAQSITNRNNLHYQYRKNEYNVSASKADIQKAERQSKVNQRKAQKFIDETKKKPFFAKGEYQGTQRERQLMKPRENAGGVTVPPAFNFKEIKDKKHLQQKFKQIEDRADPKHYDEKKERMRDNFVKMVLKSYNSDADELVKELRATKPDDFFDMYVMFKEFSFKDYYVSEDVVEMEDNDVNRLLNYIERYRRGDVEQDLKGF